MYSESDMEIGSENFSIDTTLCL